VRPLLLHYLARDPQAYCFRPTDSEAKRRAERHASRKTPLSCGTKPGDRRKRKAKRQPGDRYTTDTYRRAIARACDTAFPPEGELRRQPKETERQWRERLTDGQRNELAKWQVGHRWSPNQLRHTAGTEVRRQFGIEASRVTLGHSKISTTEIYSERDYDLAMQVARQVG